MSEALSTSIHQICEILRKPTFSPVSEFGLERLKEQAGRMTEQYGQEVVRASLSARQAKALGLLTSGTCGLLSTTLSASAALQSSLENRLAEAVQTDGSILYKLTWKRRVTPSGSSRLALRASARKASAASTSANGTTGWPTPTTRDHKDGSSEGTAPENGLLGRVVWSAGWPTPSGQNDREGSEQNALNMAREDGSKVQQRLQDFAVISGYNTPRATDGSNGGPNQSGGALSHDVNLAGWPTPMAGTPAQKGNNAAGNTDSSRQTTALLAGWPTPLSAPDSPASHNQVSGQYRRAMAEASPADDAVRLTASGEMLTGSCAGMPSGGRLRAGHSRWLMRIPPAWDDCAPTVTRSTSRKRKASLKPSSIAHLDLSDLC